MINITLDTREFDKAFKEYSNYSKRSFAESCNQHAYYIARNAVNTTKAADKGIIRSKLEAPSRDYPGVPLAAIIVNSQLGNKQQKGLTGKKMALATQRFIKKMESHVNFLRSGWIPAIKILASVVPRKGGGQPIPSGIAKSGRTYGGATSATGGWSPTAYIWNSIFASNKNGKQLQNNQKVGNILTEGAQKAVDMETQSMREYIVRKQNDIIKNTFG